MLLLAALERSVAAGRCRLFIVARDGRTCGRAGSALVDAGGSELDITGSATLPVCDAASVDRILARAEETGARYVLVGLPDREARVFEDRCRTRSMAISVVGVADALDQLAV